MDKTSLAEIQRRLEEINEIILKLDPSIRQGAFALLAQYVTEGRAPEADTRPDHKPASFSSTDLAWMLEKFGDGKPSDNVNLIFADWYQKYGSSPLSEEEIRSTATGAGLVLPSRVDKMLRAASKNGKKLYQPAGSGAYRPTVAGEIYLKETYGVRRGKPQPRAGG